MLLRWDGSTPSPRERRRGLREVEVVGLVNSVAFRQGDPLVPACRLRQAQDSSWDVCNKGHWHFVAQLDIYLTGWFAKLLMYCLTRGKANH